MIEAYISGLEHYAAGGGDLSRVQSVALFFVSRVDTEIDRQLDELADKAEGTRKQGVRELRGRAGIANAHAAYSIFLEHFGDGRWKTLERNGAGVQRRFRLAQG